MGFGHRVYMVGERMPPEVAKEACRALPRRMMSAAANASPFADAVGATLDSLKASMGPHLPMDSLIKRSGGFHISQKYEMKNDHQSLQELARAPT